MNQLRITVRADIDDDGYEAISESVGPVAYRTTYRGRSPDEALGAAFREEWLGGTFDDGPVLVEIIRVDDEEDEANP